jgi:thiosulfate/3-mercaptopyruvate sulfurtransferase
MTSDLSRWFVSTAWLADHLDDPNVVVVDGSWHLTGRDARKEYDATHIPGAVFFDIDAIADTANPLPHMMPTAAVFADAVGALGIDETQKIVVYDTIGLYSAPRVWWTFKVMGAKDVVILDGGLPQWLAEGRLVDDKAVRRAPRRFAARFDPRVVVDLAGVRDGLATATIQLIDARPAARFFGEAPQAAGSHAQSVRRGRRRPRQTDRHQLRVGCQRHHAQPRPRHSRCSRNHALRRLVDGVGRPRRHAGGHRPRRRQR